MMTNALLDPSRFTSGLTLIGVTFWIFVAIVVLASFWYAYTRNREMQKTIRLAIEKGMQLDADLVDKLVTRKSGKPEDYYMGGFVCTAVGIGLPLLGIFVGQKEPDAFSPLVGVGTLVGLIGISLIICGMMISRREKANRVGKHQM